MRLIQLINEKNHFLEKFYSLNEMQIERMNAGQFEDVEQFYNQREDLLKIIKYVDSQIHKAHRMYKDASGLLDSIQKNEIRNCLRIKETYVKKILAQDLTVLSLIDQAKTNIIRELQDIQKSKKALAGYKSKELEII